METFWFFLAAVSRGGTVPEQHLTAWKGLRERATLPGTRVFTRSSIGFSDTELDGPVTGKRASVCKHCTHSPVALNHNTRTTWPSV